MTKTRFRILSIDGGGIKGVFPSAFLNAIEERLSNPLRQYFDLIVGTSTGGIIALGLGLGFSAKELLEFYLSKGPKIFPASSRNWLGHCRNLFKSRYKNTELRAALTEVFQDSTLGDSSVRLVIPTFSSNSGEIHVYKTPHNPRLEMDYSIKAVDVALATSAAPVYLPPHISPEGVPFLDGGIWANNPTGMAVVEAIGVLDVDRKNIEVLSIGCTREPNDFVATGTGVIGWSRRILAAGMAGQSFASMGTAYLLAGHEHVHRINPIVVPGRFGLDNTAALDQLRAFGYEEARQAIPKLRERFFSQPVEQPYVAMRAASK
jgi:patatin-like phospholipase/acyl hydrolase